MTKNSINTSAAFEIDGYDGEAILPSLSNWTRQLKFNGPCNPNIKWVKEFTNTITQSQLVIDRTNSVLFSYNHGKANKAIKTHGTLTNISDEGKVKWNLDLNKNEYLLFSNGISIGKNGDIILGTSGGFNTDQHRLYSINSDGTIKWIFYSKYSFLGSPAFTSDGTILAATNEHSIYALDAQGNLRWTFKHDEQGDFCSGPIIDNNKLVYIICTEGYLYILDMKGNLKKRIDLQSAEPYDEPFIHPDGMILVPSNITALELDGNIRWRFKLKEGFITQKIFSMSNKGNVYCFASNFRLINISKSGELIWETHTKGNSKSYPPLITANGDIYTCSCIKSKDKYVSYVQAFKEDSSVRWELSIDMEDIVSIAVDSKMNIYALTNDFANGKCKLYCYGDI